EAQGLDQVPQLVRGITAGLLMLGKQRAVEVMERLGRALGGIVRPDAASLATPRLERLADAIVGVEYYMELLQAGRPEPWRMLETAEQSLADLEPGATRVVPLRPRIEEETAASAVATPEAGAPELPVTAVPAAEVPAPAAEAAAAVEAPVVKPAPPPAAATAAATLVDPEFVQLFVEEARENVARLVTLFPQWEQNPLDVESLRELRRVFHTLKGSGRMVGARRVGEFSWSIEFLLNRVIAQTLARSPDIVAIVRESVAVLPQLVDELEQGGPATVDMDSLMARADALSGREAPALPAAAAAAPAAVAPPAEVAPVETPVETAAEAAEPAVMDPVLQEIYRKETAGHVAVVRNFIERCADTVAPFAVTEALYRACHTLSGIAKTAGARQGIKVAEPMEHYVRKLFDNGHGLPDEGLALLRDTVRSLENVSEHVDENTGFFPDHGRLIAGWHALDRALDAELSHLTEAAERTVAELWPAEAAEPEPQAPAPPAEDLTEPSLQALADQVADRLVVPAEADRDYTAPHIVLAPLPPEMAAPAPPVAVLPSEPELPPVAPEPEPEFDADIAAIFSEEASELLEQAEAALLNWSRDRADRSQVTELKRLLHTLKGGSRMAGIRAMGDLSHEIESFLASIEAGSVASDQDAIGVLQAAIDELHRMRDTAGAGHPIAPAAALIARVHAVAAASSRAPVPEAAPAPAVEAPVPVEIPEVATEAVVEAAAEVAAEAVVEEAARPEAPVEVTEIPAPEVAPVEAIAAAVVEAEAEAAGRSDRRGRRRSGGRSGRRGAGRGRRATAAAGDCRARRGADLAGPRARRTGRTPGTGAGCGRPARRAAQQRGRGEHLPRARRAADDLHRVQP
ncbi:MAG: type pili sensor histidine kinase and response regulator, partial [Acidobacteria bacterium]|nr:type pili sensor histidine kinase and response regulator [Acidobacteriota bacterium]